MPLVSIIVPIYNTEAYLRRCLDSLLGQSLRDIEVLAVDDGSTDGSAAILAEYAAQEPERFRVFRKENGGQASARNLGIEKARGEWLAFVDSDDWVAPGYAEKMLAEAERSGADLVDSEVLLAFEGAGGFSYRNTTDSNPRIRAIWNSLKPSSLAEDPRWLLIHPAGSCHKLFKAELFKDLRFPTGINFEDLATTPRLLARARRISSVREPLYYYYQRGGSTSSSVNESWKGMYIVLSLLKEDFAGRLNAELQFLAAVRLLGGAGVQAIKNGHSDEELKELLSFLDREFPLWPANAYLGTLLSPKLRLILLLMRARAFGLLRLLVGLRRKA